MAIPGQKKVSLHNAKQTQDHIPVNVKVAVAEVSEVTMCFPPESKASVSVSFQLVGGA